MVYLYRPSLEMGMNESRRFDHHSTALTIMVNRDSEVSLGNSSARDTLAKEEEEQGADGKA